MSSRELERVVAIGHYLTQMEHGWRCKTCTEELNQHRKCVLCRKPYEEEEGDDAQVAAKTKQSLADIELARQLGYM